MHAVRVDGIEVAYDRVGQGPPLVLAHGATTDARLFRPQLADLADEFTVVAWDEPGAGRSSDVPPSFVLADYARCLAAVIEDVGLGPAHVLGLSWGGTVVLELYRNHPGLVRTLLLVDTFAGWKGSLSAAEVRSRVEGAERMLAVPAEEFAPTMPGLFAAEPPAEAVRLLSVMSADTRAQSMRTQATIMAGTDQRDLLPAIEVPTLLLWGELDARSPVEPVAHRFLEAIPEATLVVLPGIGHLSNMEAPDAFNRTVREFCRARS
ncbi:alpha/beta fold hydrolase [Streptomyces lomondensis]|uniref:3-oxoadipate enol-lactone hydrolase n=1 Tax=Streptomyces lomondensis TaxID=68229 RepID=A0ABQ2XJJ6_9ACTN|nr:alpha/beta hydrolase [Streptomyces lomondensis]MCF0079747.1 alpha/beta hydrolase [Streptomyces lomondensis]GGX20171.1 3-oxoadipate enol-lactone hydrolase [Streptomyces lomondensis]